MPITVLVRVLPPSLVRRCHHSENIYSESDCPMRYFFPPIKLTNPTSLTVPGVTFTDPFRAQCRWYTTPFNTCGGSLTDNTDGALNVGDPWNKTERRDIIPEQ